MKINPQNGLLEGASYTPSPNFDEREGDQVIDLLVIHNISLPPGEFGGPYVTQLFTNTLNPDEHPFFQEIKDLRVSAHLFIRRDGSVTQYVPLHKRAWHAGVSNFCGREKCNNFSIGIEMEGTDTEPYEPIQYEKLAEITHEIRRVYPKITLDNIQGHCHIAPERKTDPGEAFDWAHYKSLISNA